MGTQISGSGSTIHNFSAPAPAPLEMNICFGSLFLQMQLYSFVVRFLFFVLIKLPLYFISIEICKLQ